MDRPTSYDVFVSYARRDNTAGRVSALVAKLKDDFRAFAGRDLTVFFDTESIGGMDDWQHRIQRALRDSHLFLAVLSPAYVESEYCRWEWTDYVRYEAIRQCLGEGVAPVFFVSLPEGSGSVARWFRQIGERQAFDLRPWYDAGETALKEAHVAGALADLQAAVRERLGRAERGRLSPTNLMRHNAAFVGRVRELTRLRNSLADRKLGIVGGLPVRLAAVQGVGGMGKTELALAYAHAFAWDYPGGRWLVRCDGVTDLRAALQQLEGPLGFEFADVERRDLNAAFERVAREIGQRERMLVVLDNISDGRLVDPARLDRLAHAGKVDLIATTRLAPTQVPGAAQDFEFIAVDQLPEDDAVELLRSHQPSRQFASLDEEQSAREIAVLLDGFTLAIETAGIYLGRHAGETTIAQFLRELKTRVLEASESAAADPTVAVRHGERLLEATLAISLNRLSPAATRILTIASRLPADQIAVPWLEDVAGLDAGAVSSAVEELSGLRLFQPAGADSRIVRMHRLVQEVVARRSPAEAEQFERALQSAAHARSDGLFGAWFDETRRWEVDPITAYARQSLDEKTTEAGFIASRAGSLLHQLGRFADAEPLMRRLLAFNETESGPGSADTAASLSNLGVLLSATHRLDEAERVSRRALAIDESLYDPTHPSVSNRLGNLAQVLVQQNRLSEAEPLLRRALQINQAAYGEDAPETAIPLNNLSGLLWQTGRGQESEALLRRALAIDRRALGNAHPDVALRLRNLGTRLAEMGQPAEAEPLLREALAIEEARLGADHPHVAGTLNGLAGALSALGRSADAEPMIRRALAIDEARHGPDHPVIANRLNNLASALIDLGRASEAEPLFRRALAIEETSLGRDHPFVSAALNNLALLMADDGRADDAEPLMRRALEILMRIEIATGHKPPQLEDAFRNYQGLLHQMGWPMDRIRARMMEIYRALDPNA